MKFFNTIIFCLQATILFAQANLKPGFDPVEYISLFSLARYGSSIPDSAERKIKPETYKRVYRSKEVGLKNLWTMYLRNDNVGVINIRGTIGDKVSWAENFYASMVKATGSLQLNDSTKFDYRVAADDNAAVHIGWLFGLASMAPDIVQKIKEHHSRGVKEYLLFGHSQGGAISYLLRSYLFYLQQDGKLPADIFFKTYCSAAPKPGNINYAYDFESITRGGWQFTVINALDWVPESPFGVQRMQDMNEVNPLIHTKEGLAKQKFPLRIIGNYFYGKANRRPRKTQRLFTNFFGNMVYNKAIKKAQPQFAKPTYLQTMNYARAGNPIVLIPDADYYKKFNQNGKDYFVNHDFSAYYDLVKKIYGSQKAR